MRISDWSSDVCSSDLQAGVILVGIGAADREAGITEVDARRPDIRVGSAGRIRDAVAAGDRDVEIADRVHVVRADIEEVAGVGVAIDLGVGVLAAVTRIGHAQLEPCEARRSEEHTSELQSLMRISYAVFCLKKK